MNKIEKVAIKYWEDEYEHILNYRIKSFDPPARHNHIFNWMQETYEIPPFKMLQGFIDSAGKFLTRQEALEVAKTANQLKNGYTIGSVLTSEDLW